MEFNQKIVWVIGASSGIGEELAIQLANAGAYIVLSGRKKDALEQLKTKLPNSESHFVLPLDLEHSQNAIENTALVIQKYGRIDYLFNNGGLSQRSNAAETPMEIDRRIMEINYFGNIAYAKAVLPFMVQQKAGHIVVISSIAGKFGFFLRSAYSASKHALMGFYESLLLEQEKNNIHVTMVCPGKINTNISLNALNANGQAHGVMDHNQATGMPVDRCVNEILKAVRQQKIEVLVGNKELLAVKIKRFFPSLFWKIIRKQSAV
jgi:dehydrogenase/reductase SDR family protein 7B